MSNQGDKTRKKETYKTTKQKRFVDFPTLTDIRIIKTWKLLSWTGLNRPTVQ